MPPPIPLELISTPDLFSELARRYEHGVFYGLRMITLPDSKEPEGVESWRSWGNELVCIGMCQCLATEISSSHSENLEDVDSKDL